MTVQRHRNIIMKSSVADYCLVMKYDYQLKMRLTIGRKFNYYFFKIIKTVSKYTRQNKQM